MRKMYNMSKEERQELGLKGRKHVIDNYNFNDFEQKWIDLMDSVHEKYGSWDNRKHYESWTFQEVV